MDFLKNIGSNIVTGAKDILGRVSGIAKTASSGGSQAASVGQSMNFPVTDPIAGSIVSGKLPGPGVVQAGGAPNPVFPDLGLFTNTPGYNSLSRYTQQTSQVNPAAYQTPTCYYSSIRSAAPVSQSVGGKSVAVVTPQAASGEQGQSGQGTVGLQGQIISSQGATGLTGGGSNFTGLLGGSGGLNTPASGTTITEDKKVEEARQRILAKQTQTENTGGAVGESVQRQYDNLYVKGPRTESPITTPNIPGEIVPTDLQSIMDQTQAFLRTPQAESVSDLQSVVTSLNEVIQKTREQIEATRATPQEPIKETPEQLLWKEQLPPEERQTITALMDQARRDLGLPQIETNILDTMKNIESINTTFQQFFEDVKNNPDLPKGLARRRLEFLDKEYKSKMDSFSSLLERLTEQRTQANDTLDRQFNIIKAEKDETERMADNKRGTLELLITSGAIGGFNEDDIIRWSKEVGIPTSALRKMREVANNPKLEVRGDLKNGLYSVDKRGTVKVISQPQGDPVATNGLVAAILENPALFNQLGVGDRAAVIPQLNKQGFDFPTKLTAEQSKSQVSAQSALLAMSVLQKNIFDENGELNKSALWAAGTGIGSTATARREVVDVISRIRTGAALTSSEEAFYAKQVPNITDTKETAQQKIQQLTAFYAGIAGSSIVLQSPNGELFAYNNMFKPEQRDEVRKLLSGNYTINSY